MDLICGFTKISEPEEESQPQSSADAASNVTQNDTHIDISRVTDAVRDLHVSQPMGHDRNNGPISRGRVVSTSGSAPDDAIVEVSKNVLRMSIDADENKKTSTCNNGSESKSRSRRPSFARSLRELTHAASADSNFFDSHLRSSDQPATHAGLPHSSSFSAIPPSSSNPFSLAKRLEPPRMRKPPQRPSTPGRDRTNGNDPTDAEHALAEASMSPMRASWSSSPTLKVNGTTSFGTPPPSLELEMAHKQAVWNRQRQSVFTPGGTKGVPGAGGQTCTRNGGGRHKNKQFLDKYQLGNAKIFQEGRGIERAVAKSGVKQKLQGSLEHSPSRRAPATLEQQGRAPGTARGSLKEKFLVVR
mmetsp:Transcript_28314/g.47522  ORF Transcript_28314/g.47522 Transcript_28314/m.47522 type:complete len:358 (+) Transcript_28314:3-1076(+)